MLLRWGSRSSIRSAAHRFHPPGLQFSHPLFQVLDALPRLSDLGIQARLDLRVGGRAHGVGGIDDDFLPLDLAVDLVDKLFVVHFGGCLAAGGWRWVEGEVFKDGWGCGRIFLVV